MNVPDWKRHRVTWATVLALAIAVAGAILLHATFAATNDDGWLPPITVAVAGTWFIGGLAVVAVSGRARWPEDPSSQALPLALRQPLRLGPHPITTAVAVGVAFATVCVVGATLLIRIPWTSSWVSSALTTAHGNAAVVFSAALATGVAEEVFFRIGLRSVIPAPWYVLISTSVYGTVTAATGNGALVIAAVLLGVVAAKTFQWIPRWYAPIAVHALWTVGVVGIFPALSG